MKNLRVLFLGTSLLAVSALQAKDINEYEPNGWEAVVLCGTGDAIAGANVIWGASKKLYIKIDSQDDQQPSKIYYTGEGVDATKALEDIRAFKQVNLVLRSDDSFDFGGETTKAVLLQIKANKKGSTDRNSLLAEGGGVISLFCNLKTSE